MTNPAVCRFPKLLGFVKSCDQYCAQPHGGGTPLLGTYPNTLINLGSADGDYTLEEWIVEVLDLGGGDAKVKRRPGQRRLSPRTL